MKFGILITFLAIITSVSADGPSKFHTNYFSRKAMSKWRDYIYEDKGFRKEYTEYVEQGFSGGGGCPSDISETDVKLATATGHRLKKKSRGLFKEYDWDSEYAKSTRKLNVVEFVYHIEHLGRRCATVVVQTGREGGIITPLGYYWQKPSLYAKPKAKWNGKGYIDIDNLKVSAGEAFDEAKESNPKLGNGFEKLELTVGNSGPVYIFSDKYDSTYVDAQ